MAENRELMQGQTRLHIMNLNRDAAAALLVAASTLLTGCGGQTEPDHPATPSTASSETAAAATLPATLPISYKFTLTSACGERGLLGDYRVTVRDGEVTGVENLNKGYPYEPKATEVPTLQDIVDMAESARPDAVVEYVLDDEGRPRSLSLDPIPNGIDDEECYEVNDLVILA